MMSSHSTIHSKADFDKALETKGKFVLVHAHSGSMPAQVEE